MRTIYLAIFALAALSVENTSAERCIFGKCDMPHSFCNRTALECQPKRPNEHFCLEAEQCLSGYCETSVQVCLPIGNRTVGTPCGSHLDCQENLFCSDTTRECEPRKAVGDGCRSSLECRTGLFCDSGNTCQDAVSGHASPFFSTAMIIIISIIPTAVVLLGVLVCCYAKKRSERIGFYPWWTQAQQYDDAALMQQVGNNALWSRSGSVKQHAAMSPKFRYR